MKAFLLVVAIGGVIGLFVPTSRIARTDPRPNANAIVFTPQTRAPRHTDAVVPSGPLVLRRGASGHFSTAAAVNGTAVEFIVDTGADVVALTTDDARRARVAFDPERFSVIGQGAGGPVRGQVVTLDSVALGGKQATALRGVVLEGVSRSLLGQSFLCHLDISIRNDEMVLH